MSGREHSALESSNLHSLAPHSKPLHAAIAFDLSVGDSAEHSSAPAGTPMQSRSLHTTALRTGVVTSSEASILEKEIRAIVRNGKDVKTAVAGVLDRRGIKVHGVNAPP